MHKVGELFAARNRSAKEKGDVNTNFIPPDGSGFVDTFTIIFRLISVYH